MEIVALSHSVTQSHNYAVVLGEEDGVRRLPIVIGGYEAQAIAVAMERMTPNRPLTHDLFKNALETFQIDLKEIVINNLLDGIFYAKLICDQNGEEVEIDSRTSDALAMAVRFNCPIYTYEFILEAAGVVLEDDGAESTSKGSKAPKRKEKSGKKTLSQYSLKELTQILDEVISAEDYEQAARIRDEMEKRKSGEA